MQAIASQQLTPTTTGRRLPYRASTILGCLATSRKPRHGREGARAARSRPTARQIAPTCGRWLTRLVSVIGRVAVARRRQVGPSSGCAYFREPRQKSKLHPPRRHFAAEDGLVGRTENVHRQVAAALPDRMWQPVRHLIATELPTDLRRERWRQLQQLPARGGARALVSKGIRRARAEHPLNPFKVVNRLALSEAQHLACMTTPEHRTTSTAPASRSLRAVGAPTCSRRWHVSTSGGADLVRLRRKRGRKRIRPSNHNPAQRKRGTDHPTKLAHAARCANAIPKDEASGSPVACARTRRAVCQAAAQNTSTRQ